MKEKLQLINGIDNPLVNPKEDCLDREGFARKIFKLIEATSVDTHLRVGILGEWGSGKTTVMNFIKQSCRESANAVADFHPWQFHSREEAWKGFVSAIEDGLSKWKVSILIGSWAGKVFIKGFKWFLGVIKRLSEEHKTAKLFSDLLISPLQGSLEEKKERTTKRLRKILKNKRLYIFIDDLDRADPEIIYDMLMLLNEIVSLGQCVYIIGLDIKTVSKVLEDNLGCINSKNFLEKIINWPFELPAPASFDWERLLEKELKNAVPEIEKAAIRSIAEILPRNPRKFKHYLRYLNSLHRGFLHRFSSDEVDWRMLYSAQLLRMEFSEVFKELMYDEEIIEDIAHGKLMDTQKEVTRKAFKTDSKNAKLEWEEKIKIKIAQFKDIDSDRFLDIYEILRNCGGTTMPDRVRNHLMIIEDPELMTWKEYRDLKQRLVGKNDDILVQELRSFISESQDNKHIGKVREFMKMLMRDRAEIWTKVIDLHTQDEMKIHLDEVHKIMGICNLLLDIDEINIGVNPMFDESVFKLWLGLLSKYADFKVHSGLSYEQLRQEEKNILLKMVIKNLHRASEVAEWLRGTSRDIDFDGSQKALADVRKEIDDLLGKRLTEDLLERFERPDGINQLWPKDSFISEKRILFKDGTPFHQNEVYDKLKIIAQKARTDTKVHENFIEAITMFFYHAKEGSGWISAEDAKVLIQKSEFFSIIWTTVISRPLNRRLVGTFEDEYLKMIEPWVSDKNFFERPEWWKVLIADRINTKMDTPEVLNQEVVRQN